MELPRVQDIHSHIEPISPMASPSAAVGSDEEGALRTRIVTIAEQVPGLRGCGRFHVRLGPDGYDVVLQCLADPDLPIAKAHRLAHEAESRIRAQVPGISQVLVHVEPEREG
jgi:divalent metal cation (Fe/Co/Zn/Cd) transporter